MFSIPVGVKRKHQDADLSDDDDEPSLGRQVLPVANLPASFNGTPEDGLQYLFTVRCVLACPRTWRYSPCISRDARTLPHVTRAANPYEVKEEPRDTVRDELAAEHPLLPSERWREIFLKRFKNFRKVCYIPTCSSEFADISRIQHALQSTVGGRGPSSSRKVIPDKRERDLWWAFLAGQPQSAWDPPKKPKQPKNTRWGGYAQGPEGYGVDTLAYSEERRPPQHLSYSLEDGRVFSTSSTDMWRVSTDGVELTSAMNATMSLPTPSGTPAPPDRLEDQASTVEGSSSLHAILPPKPTPTLMRQIDHVSTNACKASYIGLTSCPAVCFASPDVLRILDQWASRARHSTLAIPRLRGAFTVDLRPSFARGGICYRRRNEPLAESRARVYIPH